MVALPPNELVLWTMVGFAVLLVVYYAWDRMAYAKEDLSKREPSSEKLGIEGG